MKLLFNLLLQPSSFAGYSVLAGIIPQLIHDPSNAALWGSLLAACAAILKSEAGRV
jgi:hypothetical protein